MNLSSIEGIINLKTVKKPLGLLINQASNQANDTTRPELHIVAAGCDADHASDDGVAQLLNVITLHQTCLLNVLLALEHVEVLVCQHQRQSTCCCRNYGVHDDGILHVVIPLLAEVTAGTAVEEETGDQNDQSPGHNHRDVGCLKCSHAMLLIN